MGNDEQGACGLGSLGMSGDEDLAAIREILGKIDVERVTQINLSSDQKEFIYFDKNPKTGKWRLTFTKGTLTHD